VFQIAQEFFNRRVHLLGLFDGRTVSRAGDHAELGAANAGVDAFRLGGHGGHILIPNDDLSPMFFIAMKNKPYQI